MLLPGRVRVRSVLPAPGKLQADDTVAPGVLSGMGPGGGASTWGAAAGVESPFEAPSEAPSETPLETSSETPVFSGLWKDDVGGDLEGLDFEVGEVGGWGAQNAPRFLFLHPPPPPPPLSRPPPPPPRRSRVHSPPSWPVCRWLLHTPLLTILTAHYTYRSHYCSLDLRILTPPYAYRCVYLPLTYLVTSSFM